jgi:hypothetical protein
LMASKKNPVINSGVIIRVTRCALI